MFFGDAQNRVLDWRAYFAKFCDLHGGRANSPVEHNGKLLFMDGWTYSNIDHAGPEWPPPDDPTELRLLQIAYWQRRKVIVRSLAQRTRETIEKFQQLTAGRSAPLAFEDRMPPEEKLTYLKGRLKWLEDDFVLCSAQLKELGATD